MPGISNHYDAMTALSAIVVAANLPLMVGPPVIQEVLDYKIETKYTPCVLIAPSGPEMIVDPQNDDRTSDDNVGYGIAIAFLADSSDESIDLEQRLGWRQTIRRRCNNVTLDLPPETGHYRCEVEPKDAVYIPAWIVDKWVSCIVVRCWFTEPRQ